MNENNTVFYSAANNGYIPFSLSSLLSVRKFVKDGKFVIFIDGEVSAENKKLAEKNEIEIIELNLKEDFSQAWDYPVECFYMFYGPEFFAKKYKYSVYIDGDVVCNKDPLIEFEKNKIIAGTFTNTEDKKQNEIFGEDWDKIKEIFNISEKKSFQKRIQSGVIYFDNRKMEEIDFYDKSVELFKESLKNEIPRKGDDSLFSLFQYKYLNEDLVQNLSKDYNFIPALNNFEKAKNSTVFFHFAEVDKPWKKNPYFHKNKNGDKYNKFVKKYRKYLLKVLGNNSLKINLIEAKNRTQEIKEKIFKAEQQKEKYSFYVFKREDSINFGDEVSVDILTRLFKKKIYEVKSRELSFESNLFLVGSLIELAIDISNTCNKKVRVWSSGFIESEEERLKNNPDFKFNLENIDFFAVRGKESLKRIPKRFQNIPLGDGALLIDKIYKNKVEKTDKIGIISHYVDEDSPFLTKAKNNPEKYKIISVNQKPEKVADEIKSCKFVFSSSLHGLIFSDVFNIPNIHIQLSDKLTGGEWKFIDYYSATERSYKKLSNLKDIYSENVIDKLIDDYNKIENIKELQSGLIKAFKDLEKSE